MANITPVDNWTAGVYQWADGDVLDGGPDSLEVLPVKQLTNRSLYQRLRNVTPWDGALAADVGYPLGACVMHAGVSWRALMDTAIEPSTDPTQWERWGYSESELTAYLRGSLLSPTECPASGPAAPPSDVSPWTLWRSVAPYAEYWQWLGDVWKVVAGHYGVYVNNGVAGAAVTTGMKTIATITAHRTGRVLITASSRMTAAAGGNTNDVAIELAGSAIVSDAIVANVASQGMFCSSTIELPVTQGQVIATTTYSNFAGTALLRSSIYFKG